MFKDNIRKNPSSTPLKKDDWKIWIIIYVKTQNTAYKIIVKIQPESYTAHAQTIIMMSHDIIEIAEIQT